MRIAVLEYTTRNVHIVDAPDALETGAEVEAWLESELGFKECDIAYMADVNKAYDYGNTVEKITRP